jgi:CRISPR-associated protein Cas6
LHQHSKTIDLAFPARGESVPLDHGYALFSAVSRLVPQIHAEPGWGIHPIWGDRVGPGRLALGRRSTVKLRIPADRVGDALALTGADLPLAGHSMVLGAARLYPIVPAATLQARIVIIKKFLEDPEAFRHAAARQVAKIPELSQDPDSVELTVGPRRVLRISGRNVVGFALVLQGLGPDASIAIQRHGIGGRRHMGAGIFVPPGSRGSGHGWSDKGRNAG